MEGLGIFPGSPAPPAAGRRPEGRRYSWSAAESVDNLQMPGLRTDAGALKDAPTVAWMNRGQAA